jgi:hypothetical protein
MARISPENPLQTAADALALVVDFAGADLAEPRAGAVWSARLATFLQPGETLATQGGMLVAPLDASSAFLPSDALAGLQREIRTFLASLISRRDHRGGSSKPLQVTTLISVFDASDLVPRRRWKGPKHPTLLMVGGSVRDVVLFQVVRLLERLGTDKVLACPECGTLFVRQTRKEYCSTRCLSRRYMRDVERPRQRSSRRKATRHHGKTRKR